MLHVARTRSLFTLLSCGVPVAILSIGCDQPKGEAWAETLPEWHAEPTMRIGLNPEEGDEFIRPSVVGIDRHGCVYVFDQALVELSRFNAEGEFVNLVASRGPGPAQFNHPTTIKVEGESLWYAERLTGRIEWITPEGKPLRTIETGLEARRFGWAILGIIGLFDNGDILALGAEEEQPRAEVFRPNLTWRFLRATPRSADLETIYAYETTAKTIYMDRGRTRISDPSPQTAPIVFYRTNDQQLVRIERPPTESARKATLTVQLLDPSGKVLRERAFSFSPSRIPRSFRQSLQDDLLSSASLGRRRNISRSVRKLLLGVAKIPRYYPAAVDATQGPNASIWIERPVRTPDGMAQWLVLDSLLRPVARALLPSGVEKLTFIHDQAWGEMTDTLERPFLSRFSFRKAVAAESHIR